MDGASLLLDGTLEDLADLKGFKNPASGAHRVVITGFEEKKINGHPAVEVGFIYKEQLELADPATDPKLLMTDGEEFNISYMLDNETGQGFFKEFMKNLGEKLGTAKLSEIAEQAKGLELAIMTKQTYDEKKDRYYCNIKSVMVT